MQNLLLDTNIFIDYLGHKKPFCSQAESLVAAGFFGDVKLWVPAQSLTDCLYVLNKYLPSDQVQDATSAICEIITPIDLSASDTLRALKMKWDDYEDCLIAVLAEKVKADAIITRDVKGFTRSLIPAMTPDAWLTHMETQGVTYTMVDL